MKKIAGRPVTCDVKNKDMYGRSVSVCYVGGGVGSGSGGGGGSREDLNAWLVSQGDAVAYEQYSKAYVPLEQQAKAERKVRAAASLTASSYTGQARCGHRTLTQSRRTLLQFNAWPSYRTPAQSSRDLVGFGAGGVHQSQRVRSVCVSLGLLMPEPLWFYATSCMALVSAGLCRKLPEASYIECLLFMFARRRLYMFAPAGRCSACDPHTASCTRVPAVLCLLCCACCVV